MNDLVLINESIWLYVATPIVVGAALWVTWVLRAPQLTKLGQALSALRETDPEADGETSSAAPLFLSVATTVGAAATVAVATAVSDGGAGILFWIWLIAFFVAPLRYAEVVLSRTDAPGKSVAGASGSLPRRLMREGGAMRGLGLALIGLLAVVGFAFFGGVHGEALLDAGAGALPTSVPTAGYAVAGLSAVLVVLGLRRGGAIAGWLGAAALLALVVAALLGASGHPDRALGTLGRMFSEAFSGAPMATPWVGAGWQEIAIAALVFTVPPLLAGTGAVGGLHGAARAKATRRQASSALLGPLVYALICTFVTIAVVGSGAYFHRIETSRPMAEVAVYELGFESRSQREEPERLYTGYLRIVDGERRDINIHFGTERAMAANERFEFRGNPADVALHMEAGHPVRMLRPTDGTLSEVDIRELDDLVVFGEMLPRGGALLNESFARGSGGDLAARLAFIALLLLLAVGSGAFGLAIGRALPAGAPAWAPIAIGLLPAAGIAAAASGAIPGLAIIGGIAAGLSASLAAIAIAARARQAS